MTFTTLNNRDAVIANLALTLPVNSFAVGGDFNMETGRRTSVTDNLIHADLPQSWVTWQTYTHMPEGALRVNANVLQLRELGRAFYIRENFDIFQIAQLPENWQYTVSHPKGEAGYPSREAVEVSAVYGLKHKIDANKYYIVATYPDGTANTFTVAFKTNRDVNGVEVKVGAPYLVEHTSDSIIDQWNRNSESYQINWLMNRYELTIALSNGLKIIAVTPRRWQGTVTDESNGEVLVSSHREHRQEWLDRVTEGYVKDDGMMAKPLPFHVLDGYRRQAARDAGLKSADFEAVRVSA